MLFELFKKVIKKMYKNKEDNCKKKFIKIDVTSKAVSNFNLDLRNPTYGRIYLNIGKNSVINCNFIFESNEGFISIGDNVSIGASSLISRSRIIIHDNVYIAWGCTLYDHDSHSLDYIKRRKDREIEFLDLFQGDRNPIIKKNWDSVPSKPIIIHDDVWIGMNCIILKGIIIGEGSIVGAGSVVTKDVPPWTVVAGNPAKVIKKIT